jgi:hypothetical protein
MNAQKLRIGPIKLSASRIRKLLAVAGLLLFGVVLINGLSHSQPAMASAQHLRITRPTSAVTIRLESTGARRTCTLRIRLMLV